MIENGRKTLAERTTDAAHLTAREADVLRLLGNGDSNKTIGETLGITLDTTKKHVRNVIDKLQARNRTHAAIIAAQSGIVGKPVTPVIETPSDLESIARGQAGMIFCDNQPGKVVKTVGVNPLTNGFTF